MSQSLHKMMGVINLTPDSFSDGGLYCSLEQISDKISNFKKQNVDIFDFGAESTAPFNSIVSEKEERRRLEPLLTYLKKIPKDSIIVSLDTYKTEIAHWFFSELNWDHGIWNDVSGIYDNGVETFLDRFGGHRYIYCHNNSTERSMTGNHMDYVIDEPIYSQLKHAFERLDSIKNKERVLFDPCFGFSKSYEQNWDIINNWEKLIKLFNDYVVIFGVSKKSFMRTKVLESLKVDTVSTEDSFYYSELLHYKLINELKEFTCNETWVRAHDPRLVRLALACHEE
jgi:dihydropteroate synthase